MVFFQANFMVTHGDDGDGLFKGANRVEVVVAFVVVDEFGGIQTTPDFVVLGFSFVTVFALHKNMVRYILEHGKQLGDPIRAHKMRSFRINSLIPSIVGVLICIFGSVMRRGP